MFRFLLFVLVVGAIGLGLTNPTTDDVRAQINAKVEAQMGTGIVPPPAGSLPGIPPEIATAVTEQLQNQIYIDRKNYYLFSVFKVTVGGTAPAGNAEGGAHQGGQQLPGCLIGVAKQAIPYDKC